MVVFPEVEDVIGYLVGDASFGLNIIILDSHCFIIVDVPAGLLLCLSMY